MSNLLNRFGFILFSATGPEATDLLSLPDGNSYCPMSAAVFMVPGETYKAYLPIDTALSFASTNIDLVTDLGKTQALTNVGTVASVSLTDDSNHYTISFGLPADTTLLPVYYRLRLNMSGGSKLYSNRLLLKKTDSGYEKISALFSYRNTRAIGPIAYDLPAMSTFRNVLRLKCYADIPKSDTSVEEYEAISTGIKRMVEGHAHQYIPFKTPDIDTIGREGWRTLLLHKDLLVNGSAFSLKSGYAESDGNALICSAGFELWESSYSIVNRC